MGERSLPPRGVESTAALPRTESLVALGANRLEPDIAFRTLGLKYREDQDKVRGLDPETMFGARRA